MENDTGDNRPYPTINERLAVVETKFIEMCKDHEIIKNQLDQLLELKSKGMGAIWLIGIVIGGGFMGVVGLIGTLFNRGGGHL